MKVTAAIQFDENALYRLYFEAVYEACIIAARRLEEEAKQFLNDRMIGQKSSGALEDSIEGFVTLKPGVVFVQLRASVFETGQWEDSMGESEEAAFTASGFNYAEAVEEGTGIYGPRGRAIEGDFVFWNGGYNSKGKRKLIRTKFFAGQPGLHYAADAVEAVLPQFIDLMNQVGENINVSEVWKKR